MDRPWLPNLLREIADRFDLPTALRFAERFGGRYLHLPARATPEHAVARAMGAEVLAWLVEQHGAERLLVPQGPARELAQQRECARLTTAGWTVDEIAAATGAHRRTVQRWRGRAERRLLERQGCLFGEEGG